MSLSLEANGLMLDGNLSVFPKSVKYLYLKNSILKKLEVDDLKGFSHLRELDLGSNSLHSIANGAFDHLKELSHCAV